MASQNFLRDCARHGRHRRDESPLAVGRNCRHHSSRDDTRRQRAVCSRGLSQKREFAAEFVEHVDEALGGRAISSVDLIRLAEGFDDQVDGAVVKMKSAAIFQQSYLGPRFH